MPSPKPRAASDRPLADAETLRAYCDPRCSPWDAEGATADALWVAAWQGARSIDMETPDLAAACARLAAHAIGRCVPGVTR